MSLDTHMEVWMDHAIRKNIHSSAEFLALNPAILPGTP